MELEIAIPTYFRAETLALKTMPLLSAFDKEIIVLYVEDEIQKNVYNQIFNNEYKIIVTNTSGIGEKRNFIKTVSKARWLLQVDDDLKSIVNSEGELTPEEIKDLIYKGFEETEDAGLRLWSIAPFSNNFYFRDTMTKSLKFCRGYFFGTIMEGEPILSPIDCFEDYWNTLEHFVKDGGIIRFNAYGAKSLITTGKGGLQSQYSKKERLKNEADNSKIILDTFGCNALKVIKKTRGVDIRLNYRFKYIE
tara:strand:+ start:2414 stop:3160 length:747 start_codon:yes stop_codon:yes gene_type:complete